ncbi:MAG: alpha/beta hydrolase [Sphingobacteriales bacterium]|nr:MAG: alpha/beta hydrolase [Sphingobacteriales bacterium]
MDKTIQSGGKQVFYRVTGTGRPVMLVHGFGETGDVWKQQVDHLEDRFLLVVPDLPGSGQSEMVDDMSMDGLAEILNAVITAEGYQQVTMIGHSMGGYITLAFASRYPDKLNAFGLFHSTAFADSEEKKTARKKGIEFIEKNGTTEFLKTTSPNLFAPVTQSDNPELIDEFLRGLDNFSIPAFVSYYESMMQRKDHTDVLKSTPLPVLFVIGEHDSAIPKQDTLKLVHLPGISYIHILHQSGHMGMLEESNKSNALLEKFLSDI